MVFVWSYLTDGNPAYALIQISINDLVLVFADAPLVMFLLGLNNLSVPWDTILLSVILYIVVPLTAGYLSRIYLLKHKGKKWFEEVFLNSLSELTVIGLLLTLIILFSFQGDMILNNPFHILLIAVPLTIQTFLIFLIAYSWSKFWNVNHSGAALATVVGVLVEVPIMLVLVKIANKTKNYF